MSKTDTRGMKLYIAGEEVTKELVEKLIEDYEKKINSPEYQEELKQFEDFIGTNKSQENPNESTVCNNATQVYAFEYYKLPFPPHTIFKLDRHHVMSYKFDDSRKGWLEFPTFLTDFEYGNIYVNKIDFEDSFPVFQE